MSDAYATPAGRRAEHFGTAPDGSPVLLARIQNGGTHAALMTWGASLQDFRIAGVAHALVLGSPDFEAYLGPLHYFGAIVGRVANRIAGGRAELDGRVLDFDRNENGRTTLHGGRHGSGCLNWSLKRHDHHGCTFSIRLPDGLDGFPGNLDLTAEYRLDETGALALTIEGRTDATTFCNMAHHSYWTLAPRAGLEDHRFTVAAAHYLPIDADKIPSAPEPVSGSPFDFTAPRSPVNPEVALDHNFCLGGTGMRPVATLSRGPLQLEIETDAPGLQVYDGALIDSGDHRTHAGAAYGANAGIALEPQFWPDAPNHARFPDITLEPGQVFRQITRFSVRTLG
ncbi:aldose epimerase family protein [Citreimonas salinaria]|uniref:Aldose 1-epimerase n=1 Tax=Citreimonas salinaria TaxID=321339 RepID=A0A1H3LX53_9RHOB|nr:aldose epimerase family protein [Citreimonas salinaria]SDY68604.1 aldose 1-epimerase [Citreimonas salinaria]